jgi:hypothetical protein
MNDDYGFRRDRMPSTETRRYADLITLVREIVNDAEESLEARERIHGEIWELANDAEKEALTEFSAWFEVEPPEEAA